VSAEGALAREAAFSVPVEQVTREVAVQYPAVERLAFGQIIGVRIGQDGAASPALDTVPTLLVTWREGPPEEDARAQLVAWLRVRLDLDTIQVLDN
jgi:hypothetical protein